MNLHISSPAHPTTWISPPNSGCVNVNLSICVSIISYHLFIRTRPLLTFVFINTMAWQPAWHTEPRSWDRLRSPLAGIEYICIHIYIYILFWMKETWGGCQCWTGDPRILETLLASLNCCSQRLDHSAMIHLSKTDWPELSGITHWLQQWVDSGQERFSTGLLTPGTGV